MRRAAPRTQSTHALRKRFGVVGKILRDFGSHIETDHKCLVVLRPYGLIEKRDGRFLLELEAVAHRVAGVHQQPDLQRQIGFAVETANLIRGLVVVDDLKVRLLQSRT